MKYFSIQNLLFSLFILCLSYPSFSQGPTNANRYNLFARLTGFYFGPDAQNGTNYPTFLLEADPDNGNNTFDHLINSDGTSYEVSYAWNADTPSTKYATKTILAEQNSPRTHMDFTMYAFDNFCGDRYVVDNCCGLFCTGTNDYENNYRWCMYRNMRIAPTGLFHTNWEYSSSGSIGVQLQRAWRYYYGSDQNSPLTFGTLAPSDYRSHLNYNRRAPSGASSYIGYLNNWTVGMNPAFDESPDVTYSFTVTEPSFLSIATYSTNFDTRIHLVKNEAGTDNTPLISNSDISNSNSNSAIDYALEPGSYFIVIEGDNGEAGQFSFYLDNTAIQLTGGSVSHVEPWVKFGCELTLPVVTETAASTFGNVAYRWEFMDSNNSWTLINNATSEELTGAELGPLEEDTKIRRIAVYDDIKRYTDPVEIKVVPISGFTPDGIVADGIIRGKVTGKNGIGVVPGVTVYAVADPPVHGECEGHIYSAVTNPLGIYEISGIYYGRNEDSTSISNAQYRVYPEFSNHIFDPEEIYVDNMWSLSNIKENVDFEDVTTLFIRGEVMQDDGTKTCPLENTQFFLNDLLSLSNSAPDGSYELAIEFQDEYVIRPSYEDHAFLPAMTTVDLMETDVNGIDFENTEVHNISGYVWACGMTQFGKFTIAVEDTLGCFIYSVDTDANGFYSIDVPARAYYLSVNDVIDGTLDPGYNEGEILNYFNEIIMTDATLEDTTYNFIYKQAPDFELVGLIANSCGDYVLAQGENTWININLSELNTNGCPLDTGTLIIIDGVSDLAEVEVPISNGVVNYEIKPGEPNLADGFIKTISFDARHIDRPELRTTFEIDIVVTGAKSREATFTTVSPQIPFIILRDPPGDGSYSYLEENQSTEIVMSLETLLGGSVTAWTNVNAGAQFEAGFLGFSTETEIWGELENSVTLGAYNRNQYELGIELTNGSTFQTSALDDPNVMGSGGDLYVGAALSLRYSKADVVSYDEANCQGQVSVELMMGAADTETQFAYSEFSILNSIIPSLESLRDEQTDQAEIDYYQNQINVWNQTVDQNNNLKELATAATEFPDNISWSGGGTSQEYFTTTSVAENITIEFLTEIESSVATDVGIEVAGTGTSGGVTSTFRMELGVGGSQNVSSSRTTGFVLVDDDALDRYETGVKICPVYNTPIFDNIAAITSCPYELSTSPIDGPVISATPPIRTNVNPNSAAEFVLRVTNLSQDEKTRSYTLDIVGGSNPNSAIINPGGGGTFPITFSNISYGEFIEQSVFISKQSSSQSYSYEGIEFIVSPAACDDEGEFVTDQTSVSVYFDATCSDVTLQEPQAGWLVNQSSNDLLNIHIKDYDVTNLNQVIVQYTEAGINAWQTAVLLEPADLNSNSAVGTFVDWDVSLLEGNFDLRVKLNCTGASIYTPRVRGTIDISPPSVMGIPRPLDDIYEDGIDELTVSFDEDIDCSNTTMTLVDIETGELIPSTMSCAGNIAELVPNPLLSSRGPAAYRVTIDGVEDEFGNTAEAYAWVFISGDYTYDPDCSPIMISNNNINQNAISQSIYSATEISSDGLVANLTSITFKAEEAINIEPGFEVVKGGQLIAEIEECEE